jgi:transposase-like protein
VKTVFAQPSQQAASQAISQALDLLESRYPKVARLLRDAEADILSYLTFPSEHWRSIRSTNALAGDHRNSPLSITEIPQVGGAARGGWAESSAGS